MAGWIRGNIWLGAFCEKKAGRSDIALTSERQRSTRTGTALHFAEECRAGSEELSTRTAWKARRRIWKMKKPAVTSYMTAG
jgi:hypothetical protein